MSDADIPSGDSPYRGLSCTHSVMIGTASAFVSFAGLAVGAVLMWPSIAYAGAIPTPVAMSPGAAVSLALAPSVLTPSLLTPFPHTVPGECAAIEGDAGALAGPVAMAQYGTQAAAGGKDTSALARYEEMSEVPRYTSVASGAGGTLGIFLRTVENMEPALKATSGQFSAQVRALDTAYRSMVRAARRPGDATGVEKQGLDAIQLANEAINAQGKTEEYTDNLYSTGAGQRQWGTGSGREHSDPEWSQPGPRQALASTAGATVTTSAMMHCR